MNKIGGYVGNLLGRNVRKARGSYEAGLRKVMNDRNVASRARENSRTFGESFFKKTKTRINDRATAATEQARSSMDEAKALRGTMRSEAKKTRNTRLGTGAGLMALGTGAYTYRSGKKNPSQQYANSGSRTTPNLF